MEHHQAIYNGKIVNMDYVDKKDEFKRACMRIIINGANGIVKTPKGVCYQVTQSSRKAKRLDPFNYTDKELLAYMHEEGNKRFGSECKHENIKNGRCTNCLRVVVK